jgi:hypothetical protein
MQMPVGEWLGWVTSFVQSFGLQEVIVAGFVIFFVAVAVRMLIGRGGE